MTRYHVDRGFGLKVLKQLLCASFWTHKTIMTVKKSVKRILFKIEGRRPGLQKKKYFFENIRVEIFLTYIVNITF